MSWIDIDLCRSSCLGHKIPAIENLGIAKVCLCCIFRVSRAETLVISDAMLTKIKIGPRCNRLHRQRHFFPIQLPLLPSPPHAPPRAKPGAPDPVEHRLLDTELNDANPDGE